MQERKEKTTPFGVNVTRSLVISRLPKMLMQAIEIRLLLNPMRARPMLMISRDIVPFTVKAYAFQQDTLCSVSV